MSRFFHFLILFSLIFIQNLFADTPIEEISPTQSSFDLYQKAQKAIKNDDLAEAKQFLNELIKKAPPILKTPFYFSISTCN